MRDRTASRNYSPERDEFRRVHAIHRAWGLERRYSEKRRRLRSEGARKLPTPADHQPALESTPRPSCNERGLGVSQQCPPQQPSVTLSAPRPTPGVGRAAPAPTATAQAQQHAEQAAEADHVIPSLDRATTEPAVPCGPSALSRSTRTLERGLRVQEFCVGRVLSRPGVKERPARLGNSTVLDVMDHRGIAAGPRRDAVTPGRSSSAGQKDEPLGQRRARPGKRRARAGRKPTLRTTLSEARGTASRFSTSAKARMVPSSRVRDAERAQPLPTSPVHDAEQAQPSPTSPVQDAERAQPSPTSRVHDAERAQSLPMSRGPDARRAEPPPTSRVLYGQRARPLPPSRVRDAKRPPLVTEVQGRRERCPTDKWERSPPRPG